MPHGASLDTKRRTSHISNTKNPRPGGRGTRVPLCVRHACLTAYQEERATGGKPASSRLDHFNIGAACFLPSERAAQKCRNLSQRRHGQRRCVAAQRRDGVRGSVQRKSLSGTLTPYWWFDRRIVVRLFCESRETQLDSSNPPGADALRVKIRVMTPNSGWPLSRTSMLITSGLVV